MKSKYQKTIKYLSDGTIAKVGMIVYHKGVSSFVTKIKRVIGKKNPEFIEIENTIKDPICGEENWTTIEKYLRRATPEERKRYYQQLKNNEQ